MKFLEDSYTDVAGFSAVETDEMFLVNGGSSNAAVMTAGANLIQSGIATIGDGSNVWKDIVGVCQIVAGAVAWFFGLFC